MLTQPEVTLKYLPPCSLHGLNALLFFPSSPPCPVAHLLWDWDAPAVRDDFFGKAKALLLCVFLLSLASFLQPTPSHAS